MMYIIVKYTGCIVFIFFFHTGIVLKRWPYHLSYETSEETFVKWKLGDFCRDEAKRIRNERKSAEASEKTAAAAAVAERAAAADTMSGDIVLKRWPQHPSYKTSGEAIIKLKLVDLCRDEAKRIRNERKSADASEETAAATKRAAAESSSRGSSCSKKEQQQRQQLQQKGAAAAAAAERVAVVAKRAATAAADTMAGAVPPTATTTTAAAKAAVTTEVVTAQLVAAGTQV